MELKSTFNKHSFLANMMHQTNAYESEVASNADFLQRAETQFGESADVKFTQEFKDNTFG